MGDHLRALQYVIEIYGKRGGFSEGKRDREFIGKYKPILLQREKAKYSAIIPVSEEKDDYKICYTRSEKSRYR